MKFKIKKLINKKLSKLIYRQKHDHFALDKKLLKNKTTNEKKSKSKTS